MPNPIALKQQEQGLHGGATHVQIVAYSDLTDADTAQTFSELAVNAGDAVMVTQAELIEPFVFSDAAVTNLALIVGDGGSTNRFLTSTELASAGTEVFVKGGALTNATIYQYTSADTVDATFTSTGGNLNTATAGKVAIYYRYVPKPANQV